METLSAFLFRQVANFTFCHDPAMLTLAGPSLTSHVRVSVYVFIIQANHDERICDGQGSCTIDWTHQPELEGQIAIKYFEPDDVGQQMRDLILCPQILPRLTTIDLYL